MSDMMSQERDGSAAPPSGALVGALIVDGDGRVMVQRRSRSRRLFPGAWDVVGGAVEPGEDELAALHREVREETGWEVQEVVAWVADLDVDLDGTPARERVALVRADGPGYPVPTLEEGKHDAWAWVDTESPELTENRRLGFGDHLHDVVVAGLRWSAERDPADR